MNELAEERTPVRYEAILDGERKFLSVRVTGVSPHGFAFFEGSGEPELAAGSRAAGPSVDTSRPLAGRPNAS